MKHFFYPGSHIMCWNVKEVARNSKPDLYFCIAAQKFQRIPMHVQVLCSPSVLPYAAKPAVHKILCRRLQLSQKKLSLLSIRLLLLSWKLSSYFQESSTIYLRKQSAFPVCRPVQQSALPALEYFENQCCAVCAIIVCRPAHYCYIAVTCSCY